MIRVQHEHNVTYLEEKTLIELLQNCGLFWVTFKDEIFIQGIDFNVTLQVRRV